jgi:hypothetical protein
MPARVTPTNSFGSQPKLTAPVIWFMPPLVRLLQHLKKRYIHNLEIRDATGFADFGDETRLLAFFNALIAVSN